MKSFRDRSFNFRYLIVMAVFIIVGALLNNLRQPVERHVAWIGGQEILAKPAPEAAQ